MGPPGPPGPPGPAVVSARSHGITEAQVILGGAGGGQCGCNESLVEGVIMSLASVLPKGDRGQVGIPGKPGLTGATGPRGASGDIGAPGAKGERGERGETGHRSAETDGRVSTCIFFCRGREGIQGQKGEAGRDGSPGLDGRAGLPGPPGPPGFMNGYDVSGNLNEEVK